MDAQLLFREQQVNKAKIVVIGTGYVGLPAALMLAKAGHKVVGVDIDENIVRAINERVLLIEEEELREVMESREVRDNLIASTTVIPGDVYLIAVPTPLHPRKRSADLDYVTAAMESICPHLKKGDLVLLESTVPPLTCRELIAPMVEKSTGLSVPEDVLLAHCPERILPGKVFDEIVHNDRIIGGMNAESTEKAREVYASFVRGELLPTDDVTAELCKLMENTYRDVNIGLSNEMAAVADTLGVDWRQAFDFANRHPRVSFLDPGIGVGGHCIPIDPWFIKEVDPINTQIIEVARRVNAYQPHKIAARIRRQIADVKGAKIICIGATYKPNTADCRESPAIEIVELLQADGYDVENYDPLVKGMEYSSLTDVCTGADLLVILVGHNRVISEYEAAKDEILAAMRNPRTMIF